MTTDCLVQTQWQPGMNEQAFGALSHTGIATLDDVAADDAAAPMETAPGAAGVRLRCYPSDIGFLSLRARPSARETLSGALHTVAGLSLPTRLRGVYPVQPDAASMAIRWMSPDEWLLSAPAASLAGIERDVRQRVSGGIAIVNVSGNHVGLILEGADARAVLMKSTGYDVHADHFLPGKVVNTTFAKAGVTLGCLGGERFELLVRRSLADYLWVWLQNAALEFGLDTGTETLPASAQPTGPQAQAEPQPDD